MPNDEYKMLRVDLFEWVKTNGCTVEPIEEYKARVIHVVNPRTGATAWINLPINNQPVRDFTVYRTCFNLGIPIPDCVDHMKDVHDIIENKQTIQKKKKK